MSSLPTRVCKIASLKCKPKWDIFVSASWDKNKGKRAVFPYEKCKLRKHFLSLSSSIVLSQQVPSDKSRQHQSSPFLPNQNCSKKHHLITKKADIFSLLSLHFFCALHFDLLFCKLDFFQSQQRVQSLTSNIFCYLTS